MDKDTRLEHPSYGMVQFSHRTGNPKLFNSAIDTHYNFVCLTVKTACLLRSDTGDRIYGPTHGDIVEVYLSSAQFVELITTMNIGLGVACTIKAREGQMVEPPPEVNTQSENLRSEFKDRARSFSKKILGKAAEVREMLKTKANINKGDREKIAGVIDRVAQELESNIPFLITMYEEAAEKVTNAAKLEVEAFMVGAIQKAGLMALAAGKVEVLPPQLQSTNPPKDG